MRTTARVDDDFEWIIYVRISDDREGRGLGVKRQADDGYALAEIMGGKVLTVCSDNDMTANDKSNRYKPRPEYDRMCDLLRARPGKRGIIAWHTDRLHRNPTELEEFIVLVEQTGAEVQTAKSGALDLSTAAGRMAARVYCAVAKHESEQKSERISRKALELAEAGEIASGGPRPFGYDRFYAGDPKLLGNRRKVVGDRINDEEAEVIQECARRILDGDSLRSVVRWMNEDRKIRSSTGKKWSQQALRLMMYSGRIAGLREHHGKVVSNAVWGREMVLPDGQTTWGSIITKEDHERLRTVLAAKERAGGSLVRLHWLSGYVYCSAPACLAENTKMAVGKNINGKLKYVCPPDRGCMGRSIVMPELELFVSSLLVAKVRHPKFFQSVTARQQDTTGRAAMLVEGNESDERRLSLLRAQLEDGDEDDIPEIAATVRTLRRRIEERRAELGTLANMPSATNSSIRRLQMSDCWDELDLDQKRLVLGMLIDQILIFPARRGCNYFDENRVKVKWRKLPGLTK